MLLVLAVIGGTVYFFFRKIEKENNNTGSIIEMLESESKNRYNENLAFTYEVINQNKDDDRLNLIIETSNNLDNIVRILISYYVESETAIDNEIIAKQLKKVHDSRDLLDRMLTEYLIKKESEFFDHHEGANDLYEQSCRYLIEYATFANLINESITNVDRTADIKFNIFEVYSNVVKTTFAFTKEEYVDNTVKVVLENTETIALLNGLLKIENSYVVTVVDKFSMEVRDFNEYYLKCDKFVFASNLLTNIEIVSESRGSNEKIATYYFKEVFDLWD